MRRKINDAELRTRLRDAIWDAEDNPAPTLRPSEMSPTALLAYERYSFALQFASMVKREMAAQDISQVELARRLGVSEGRVSQLLGHGSRSSNLTNTSMAAVATALGKHLQLSLVDLD